MHLSLLCVPLVILFFFSLIIYESRFLSSFFLSFLLFGFDYFFIVVKHACGVPSLVFFALFLSFCHPIFFFSRPTAIYLYMYNHLCISRSISNSILLLSLSIYLSISLFIPPSLYLSLRISHFLSLPISFSLCVPHLSLSFPHKITSSEPSVGGSQPSPPHPTPPPPALRCYSLA